MTLSLSLFNFTQSDPEHSRTGRRGFYYHNFTIFHVARGNAQPNNEKTNQKAVFSLVLPHRFAK